MPIYPVAGLTKGFNNKNRKKENQRGSADKNNTKFSLQILDNLRQERKFRFMLKPKYKYLRRKY